jgi:hypothetical protein
VTLIDWLSIVSGIVGIAGFLFSFWVWQRAETRVHEITASMQALHDIADSALWETQMLPGEDSAERLNQLERSVGLVSAMRTLSAKYVGDYQNYRATELGALIQRGIVWSHAMMASLERSPDNRTVWLITHDLEPDLSDKKTGEIVKSNLAAGKRYVYFYPADLKLADEKQRRLRRNVGADSAKLKNSVTFVPVNDGPGAALISTRKNVILFFKDDPAYGTNLIFEEVVLHKINQRGLLWQECDRDHAATVFDAFRAELAAARAGSP